ncbi:hypothetical protein H7F33_01130 [Pedobacter sp. PAMC26386]|nr:hypothetical protein H7F33_01130 [Pedobacter sp. PAMC26386]
MLSAIIIGAVYVSVINDLSDITEDAIAGKNNRMAKISQLLQITIVGLCLIAGIINGYFISGRVKSLFLHHGMDCI